MNTAIIPTYQITVTLPASTAWEITCDNTSFTCDSDYTVDYLFKPIELIEYTLPDNVLLLLCDNTYITADNLVTVDKI